jgi:Na+/H+ antiporter NhaC
VSGGGFVLTAFLIAAAVSTSTGTSLGTLIICVPLLYPAAAALGAEPMWLVGAILAGATFGDNISPVSDTTIASATTQDADIGGVVRSRLKYALPAAILAVIGYALLGGAGSAGGVPGPGGARAADTGAELIRAGSLRPLIMLLPPTLTIAMLLRRSHLMPSLMVGVASAAALGVAASLFTPADLLHVDREAFIARGIVLEGMERGVGISVFTLLLMGLVGGIEAAGLMDRMLERAERAASTPARTEWSIFGAVSAAVLLTTHSVVAILAVGRLARDVGPAFDISPYRRANILDVTVCTYPFLLPFFIPTILAGSLTGAGAEFGVARVTALQAGMANLHSWGLLIVLLAALATGRGRSEGAARD